MSVCSGHSDQYIESRFKQSKLTKEIIKLCKKQTETLRVGSNLV